MTVASYAPGTVFARNELWADLTLDELREVEQIAQVVRVNRGDRVFALGDNAVCLFCIGSGTVALTFPLQVNGQTEEITIEEKSAGAVIAWSSMVPPHKLTLGGRAATDAVLVGIERTALNHLFERRPNIERLVARNLNRVIGNRVSMLEALLARDLQRRVSQTAMRAVGAVQ